MFTEEQLVIIRASDTLLQNNVEECKKRHPGNAISNGDSEDKESVVLDYLGDGNARKSVCDKMARAAVRS